MCKLLLALAFPTLLGSLTSLGADHSHVCKTCEQKTYGTSLEWVANPSAAAAQAKKEEKLVFVLHVSGHFEDAAVT